MRRSLSEKTKYNIN